MMNTQTADWHTTDEVPIEAYEDGLDLTEDDFGIDPYADDRYDADYMADRAADRYEDWLLGD